MNQGLVSIAVLSLFLGGCDLGTESNSIKNTEKVHSTMADNKQANLQDIDTTIISLDTKLERAKKGLILLEELKEAMSLQKEICRTLVLYASDPAYTREDVNSRTKGLIKVGEGLSEVWRTEVERFSDQQVTDTSNKESRLQDSINTLDSAPIRDAWEKVSSLRQMLEEQKTLIKQVRDEDIEKTFAEAENFVKDSEERLKNAMEARKHNDYELSHLHLESIHDKLDLIADTVTTASERLRTLNGNTSLLISSKLKTNSKFNKIGVDIKKVESMQPSELEYLKTSNLNSEEGLKRVSELLDKGNGYLQEAIKERKDKHYRASIRLSAKSQRFINRSTYFINFLKARFPNTLTSSSLIVAQSKNHGKLLHEYLDLKATASPATLDFSTWDKLKDIESSLKKAEEVADHVDKEIGLYLKYRDREAPISSDTQSPIDTMKQES
ncbi:MAG: hypothetical protein DBO98_03045 [Candidatus Liberibacter europaeus]|nr:hypothetical protein [Candidatus Liberibacter europaeus]